MSEDRYTFSNLISFLIELEEKITEFYRAAAEKVIQDELRETFLSFSREDSKHKNSLSKVRRETVVEMSLEPITGLKLEERFLLINSVLKDNSLNDLKKALALEEMMQELYITASKRVIYISADMSVLMDGLSEDNSRRKVYIDRALYKLTSTLLS